jgi:hypothetical protein
MFDILLVKFTVCDAIMHRRVFYAVMDPGQLT